MNLWIWTLSNTDHCIQIFNYEVFPIPMNLVITNYSPGGWSPCSAGVRTPASPETLFTCARLARRCWNVSRPTVACGDDSWTVWMVGCHGPIWKSLTSCPCHLSGRYLLAWVAPLIRYLHGATVAAPGAAIAHRFWQGDVNATQRLLAGRPWGTSGPNCIASMHNGTGVRISATFVALYLCFASFICSRVSKISTFVNKLMGSGLIWFSEALRVQWCHFSRTELLYAMCISTKF